LPRDIAQGSIRFSFGTNISKADVDYVVEELAKAVAKLRAISPIQAGRI
ncbi:MAG TPA: cysteine desulfurase NifS, partial [Candidatus Caccovivens faecavium]|nr:cysteine desulfurase NifS [Candidatus Caccovivens faecavium]